MVLEESAERPGSACTVAAAWHRSAPLSSCFIHTGLCQFLDVSGTTLLWNQLRSFILLDWSILLVQINPTGSDPSYRFRSQRLPAPSPARGRALGCTSPLPRCALIPLHTSPPWCSERTPSMSLPPMRGSLNTGSMFYSPMNA